MKTDSKHKLDNKIQPRYYEGSNVQIEQRDDGEPSRKITGYAAVFNRWSSPLGYDGWFREKIDPAAFNNVLDQDIVAVFNHDNNIILARNKKTMQLSVDDVGLRYEFDAPSSPNGDNVLAAIAREDVIGSSFRFLPKSTQWEKSEVEGIEEDRTILEIQQLIDVGPVTFPAYPDATAEVDKRDYDNYLSEHPREPKTPANEPCEWQRSLKEKELELYKI